MLSPQNILFSGVICSHVVIRLSLIWRCEGVCVFLALSVVLYQQVIWIDVAVSGIALSCHCRIGSWIGKEYVLYARIMLNIGYLTEINAIFLSLGLCCLHMTSYYSYSRKEVQCSSFVSCCVSQSDFSVVWNKMCLSQIGSTCCPSHGHSGYEINPSHV